MILIFRMNAIVEKQQLLDKIKISDFEPSYWAQTGLQQTIMAYCLPYNPMIDNQTLEHVLLEDGDKIVIALNFPKPSIKPKRVVLLIHGLSGTYLSKYMIRLTQRLTQSGMIVARMNLRGCGPGKFHAKKLYHAGTSPDARMVLQWLAKRYPQLATTCIGFSLGANISLKLGGESGFDNGNLDSLVAISPPLDLYSCVKLLAKPPNKFLDKRFAQELVMEVTTLHQFLGTSVPNFPQDLSVYDFDEFYTAPQNGFQDAKDYYTQSSALPFIEHIKLPTFILYAKNDPIIFTRNFKYIPRKPNIDLLITESGGHVGWVNKTNWQGIRWMDNAIEKWIKWFEENQ
ncbi:MAG: YheT family hydrolase [Candidatus Berkiella sp.]